MIREIKNDDLKGLLELYTHLHEKEVPEIGEKVLGIWDTIMNDPNHHIIVAEEDGRIVSSCVCLIIPNLTRGLKPHAFIENVVTDSAYRKRGLATACLNYAKEIAEREGCYKLLLATGSKEESTLRFYERAGYNKKDKTAFTQWL
ncbi:MAG: GNAT family N-acetyltransferase [Ruminococcus sp.]|nr:GNAT family N-acetyltransferase [Ruminococcus sp.]